MDFRGEARAWLEDNCPDSLRRGLGGYTAGGRKAVYANPDTKLWLDRMAERGWTAPMWPKEYGGGGLDVAENIVLDEEMRRINAPAPLSGHGLTMIGPAILEFGNEAQCREHLPPITRGDIRWCQGYSEPGAGSDLASLQMRAVEDGDDYVVNGSKIWTSGADGADWIFCLVRTDPKASKHEGISFLVLDMDTEGVTVSPIELISGSSEFCQTFFDNVRVPKRHLIGKPGEGLDRRQTPAPIRAQFHWRSRRHAAEGQDDRRVGQGIRRRRQRSHRRSRPSGPRHRSADRRRGLPAHDPPLLRGSDQFQGAEFPVLDVQALRHRAEREAQ